MALDPIPGVSSSYWWIAAITVEADDSLTVHVEANRERAHCPLRGVASGRRHSRYERNALDLPWRRTTVRLRIHARRVLCDEPFCPRRVFCERFDDVVPLSLAARTRRAGRG